MHLAKTHDGVLEILDPAGSSAHLISNDPALVKAMERQAKPSRILWYEGRDGA